jgi:hypothetical protein
MPKALCFADGTDGEIECRDYPAVLARAVVRIVVISTREGTLPTMTTASLTTRPGVYKMPYFIISG